jgi:hypothetical protein
MTTLRRPNSALRCERLEDRHTPAQFGVPWTDPLHLTLSFAPDGTAAAGEPSRLVAALDAQMPRAVWQDAIVKAAQAWAEVANVNVGVAADGGQPFGTTGATQHDPRFGDIRVGGLPMTAEALAVSTPPAAFVSGTLAGDLFVNTAARFTPTTLYAVALHEFGHALGLPHSTDPKSVMYSHLNTATALSAGDVAAARGLYGPRAADPNEGAKGNDTVKNATRLKYSVTSSGFDGSTPVVGYGDVTTRTDVDIFYLRQFPGYTGPISFRVQTAGISLLAPAVTVTDSAGRVLATKTAVGTRGDTLTVTLPTTKAGETYYVRVTAAAGAANGVGRFAVAGTFDALLKPTALSLDEVMRGPYETLKPEEQQKLFTDPNSVFFDDDLHTNDEAAFAVNLRPGLGTPSDRHLQATASLSDGTDADWYRVRTPDSPTNSPWVLTATVRAVSPNGVVPRVEVYDGNLVRVPAEVIANGNGTFTVQATGVPPGGRSYYLRVFSPTATGNYAVDVTFGTAAADLKPLASATLTTPASTAGFKLYVGQTQLLSTTLTATGAAGGVRMEIVNAAGVVVHSLFAAAGDTGSGVSALLTPGEYAVRFTAVGATGPLAFTLRGAGLTDPIGPVKDSATLAPQYQIGTSPPVYKYPDGTVTSDPYLFWTWFLT